MFHTLLNNLFVLKNTQKDIATCVQELCDTNFPKTNMIPTYRVLLFFLFGNLFISYWPHSKVFRILDLSSLTRNQTCAPCSGSTES